MKLLDFLRAETGRQYANRTARHRKSIWDRPRLGELKMRQVKRTQENARRRRQIERGMLKVG